VDDVLAVLRALDRHLTVSPITVCPDPLDGIAAGMVDLDLLPEPARRKMLRAFAVRMRHDQVGGTVEVQITVTPETMGLQRDVAYAAIVGGGTVIMQPCALYPLPDSNRRYRLERAAS
jgi:hypothetical protein